jgi:hypothetical protein
LIATSRPFLIGYHGCDLKVAEKILAGRDDISTSANNYDWLGPGAYFWVDDAQRALEWSIDQKNRGLCEEPYLIGAIIDVGNCLNINQRGMAKQIKDAYVEFKAIVKKRGFKLPINRVPSEGGTLLLRSLDCAVINHIHLLKSEAGEAPYDSVLGVFEEGAKLFPKSCIRDKSHTQIAVRNPSTSVIGYFRHRPV